MKKFFQLNNLTAIVVFAFCILIVAIGVVVNLVATKIHLSKDLPSTNGTEGYSTFDKIQYFLTWILLVALENIGKVFAAFFHGMKKYLPCIA